MAVPPLDFTHDLKGLFELYDPDKTGKIPTKSIQKCLNHLASDPSPPPVVFSLLAELDAKLQTHSELTFEDFNALFSCCLSTDASAAEISQIFKLFDPHDTGQITAATLEAVVKELGENYTPEQIQQMIDFADLNGDSTVSLEEFAKIMKPLSVKQPQDDNLC